MAVVPLGGILKVIAIYLVPIAILAVAQHRSEVSDFGLRLGRRLHLLPEPMPDPWGPPLETLAAKLRRLRPRVISPREGMAMAKLRGIVAAYDDTLVETARALEVPTTLAHLPTAGFDREAERLRLERALARAGLVWDEPRDWPRDPAA